MPNHHHQDLSVVNRGRSYQDGGGPLRRGPVLTLLARLLGIENEWGRNTFQPEKEETSSTPSSPPTSGSSERTPKRTLWRRQIAEMKAK